MAPSVVIAAGGTAGHLVPGFAVAEAIAARSPGASISFVGTARGLERDLVPAAGYRLHTTTVRPFARSARGLAAGLSIAKATAEARAVLAAERAAVVVGMGGYPSVPAIVAARTMRIPALIHEANAIPGLANQLAARFTSNVAVTFDVTARAFRRARVTGMPLRASIARLDRAAVRDDALAAFSLDPGRVTVLVTGGSLGAARLNYAAAEVARRWSGRDDVQLLWSVGKQGGDIAPASANVRALPYIERMDLAYAAADVVVSRAGASSVCEIAAAGLPSILVPYPHARRREQDANAATLADAGAARVVADAALTGDRLASLLDGLLSDGPERARMGAAARAAARLDAAEAIAAWALELAEGARAA